VTQPRSRILAVGTVSLDTIESGGRIARDVLGGSAPYFGAAARLFGDVDLLGVVGDDFPTSEVARLERAGVGVRGIQRRPGRTFRWHVRYGADGSRETLATNREHALRGTPEVPEGWAGPRALFLGSTDPAIQASVLAAAGPADVVVLDTMTHWVRDRRAEFELVARSADVVLLNQEEALVFGEGDESDGVRRLLEAGCSWVVLKRGEDGANAFGSDRAIAVSVARPRAVLDPTGAGDAFAAGLVTSLAESWPDRLGMEEALVRAGALASLVIESFSIDRLLEVTPEGVGARGREIRVRVRRHPNP